ncbi:MAG TPA: AIM24 family protein [Gaiellales bacterium]|nr:AIM24 family protein [Gaiellales bacterium]
MSKPELVAVEPLSEAFPGGMAHREGTLVPELLLELDGSGGIFFEHHTLLWKDPAVQIGLKKLPGGIKRKIAGLDFFLTMTSSAGRIAFSMDAPGRIIGHHLHQGDTLLVREHQFVAATDNLDYSFERVQGVRNMLVGGSGLFVDRFSTKGSHSTVWLHAGGDLLEVALGAGEQIDVEAGSWLYRDASVKMEAVTMGLKTGLFGGGGKLTWNRFTGPGRLGIQTLFIDPSRIAGEVGQTAAAGGIGGLIGAAVKASS